MNSDDADIAVDACVRAPDRLALAWDLCGRGHPARSYAIALDVHGDAIRREDETAAADSADCLANCCMRLGQYEQGVRFARIARNTWRGQGEHDRTIVAAARLAMLLAWIGEPDAITEAEAATDLASEAGHAGSRVWALQATCLAFVLLKQPDRAAGYGERAVQLDRSHDVGCLWAYLSLSEALVWSALGTDPPAIEAARPAVMRAIGLTREALAKARAVGDGWFEGALVNNVAEYSLYIDDREAAERSLAECDAIAGDAGDRLRAHHLLLRGRLASARGDHRGALAILNAWTTLDSADDPELASLWQHDLSEAHERLGQFKEALDAFRAYHALHVRRASADAERRTRLCALHHESRELQAAAEASRELAADLIASNHLLAQEAQRLLRTSLEDPLTGLPNRRKLDMALLDATGDEACFAVAMMDIDHFKQINDRFSHAVGDAVLCKVGELLASATRAGDLAARYGGEEFALLMRRTGTTAGAEACERLRATIAAYAWQTLRPGLSVTMSIGLADSDEVGPSAPVLSLADERLYAAKRNGRNRVCCSNPKDIGRCP